MKRLLLNCFLTLILLAAWAAGVFYLQYQKALNAPLVAEGDGIITVKRGDTLASLNHELVQRGVIHSDWVLPVYARLNPQAANIKAGDYRIDASASLPSLMNDITNGKVVVYNITVVEGKTFKDLRANLEQTAGYGLDPYCEAARARIRAAVGSEAADVHFLVGGTQTNATVITSILRPWQGVIAADSGHIAVHETGAIEAGGHKVLTLPAADGKLDAAQLRDFMERYWQASGVKEHIVQPGMVYLSQPTELGTVYSKAELAALAQTCRHYRLPLFVDGARLGYALAPEVSDLTLPDLAALCDVFYIGGTKCGALFGEAVVITNDAYKEHFRAMMKRGGGLLAKFFQHSTQSLQSGLYARQSLHLRHTFNVVDYRIEIRQR